MDFDNPNLGVQGIAAGFGGRVEKIDTLAAVGEALGDSIVALPLKAPPQSACCSVGRMGSMRARSNSIPALPYMARLSVFSRLI